MTDTNLQPLEGLTADETNVVVNGGITFLRAITETYGPERGQELWNSMVAVLGPAVQHAI
jgi:hypothetical protein